MTTPFKTIGLFAKYNSDEALESLNNVIEFLQGKDVNLLLEEKSASLFKKSPLPVENLDTISQKAELMIVVGGDGSLLNAGRTIVNHQTPIVGVNRGKLGFLADVSPTALKETLSPILEGEYIEEERILLNCSINQKGTKTHVGTALNDIVMYNGDVARMIEFDVFIDDQFVLHQRSDGLITATPTGSTAYALSGGGPIMYPTLDALTLVPMFPHTLSSRPIVVSDNSQIKLVIPDAVEFNPKISCDGQIHIDLEPGDEILIEKHEKKLRLIHPSSYNYFSVLRKKLGWNVKASQTA